MKNSKKIFLLQSGLYGKDSTDLTMSFISEQGALKYAFKEKIGKTKEDLEVLFLRRIGGY